jgi:threonine/homoserine/homoserine lactone efflux protein
MELYLAFAITTATFALIPGPAMLYAAARTLAGGRPGCPPPPARAGAAGARG